MFYGWLACSAVSNSFDVVSTLNRADISKSMHRRRVISASSASPALVDAAPAFESPRITRVHIWMGELL